jgi:hypothetical protein
MCPAHSFGFDHSVSARPFWIPGLVSYGEECLSSPLMLYSEYDTRNRNPSRTNICLGENLRLLPGVVTSHGTWDGLMRRWTCRKAPDSCLSGAFGREGTIGVSGRIRGSRTLEPGRRSGPGRKQSPHGRIEQTTSCETDHYPECSRLTATIERMIRSLDRSLLSGLRYGADLLPSSLVCDRTDGYHLRVHGKPRKGQSDR